MIRSTQKRHLLALLTVVLALFALLLMHPTAGAAGDSSDTLVGANIKDGVLLGYYGLGGDIVLPNTVSRTTRILSASPFPAASRTLATMRLKAAPSWSR